MSDLTTISTHVLDTALGKPAAGIPVTLERVDGSGAAIVLASGVTDAHGRVAAFVPKDGALHGGSYRMCFNVAGYFAATRRETFYSEICIAFQVSDDPQHYHVPLLLSPFGYSTYRGS